MWRQRLGPSGARDMSLSMAAKLRSEQLGLNVCSDVLLRMGTEFVNDPEYLFAEVLHCHLWHALADRHIP